jgi:NADPH:quinone reductase-like Zn-dependent oxidoreductase
VKAARFSQFGGPEVLEIVDLPDPHAGPGGHIRGRLVLVIG